MDGGSEGECKAREVGFLKGDLEIDGYSDKLGCKSCSTGCNYSNYS